MKNKITKKKISLKEWSYIGKCNYAEKWCRPFCVYMLTKPDDISFVREQKLNLLAYIIIFIPIHILQVFLCLWDGGLKEFTILERTIGSDYLGKGDLAFERALKVWQGEKIESEEV